MELLKKGLLSLLIASLIYSCGKSEPILKDFSISGSTGLVRINEDGATIDIILYTASLESLVPTFTADNCSITVNGVLQESGVTANNFSIPVEYIVTSEDNISRKYVVKASIDPVSYKIGEKGPAGGFIFYINPNSSTDGWKYLEAYRKSMDDVPWGTYEASGEPPYRIDGAYGSEIGTGKPNTLDMITLDSLEVTAATICNDFTVDNNGNNYNDWFLPSLEELELIYNELYSKDIGSYWAINGIWSSTQSNIIDEMTGAYQLDFDSGKVYDIRKFFTLDVIPVRAF